MEYDLKNMDASTSSSNKRKNMIMRMNQINRKAL